MSRIELLKMKGRLARARRAGWRGRLIPSPYTVMSEECRLGESTLLLPVRFDLGIFPPFTQNRRSRHSPGCLWEELQA